MYELSPCRAVSAIAIGLGLEMLLAHLAPTAFSTHGAPKATAVAGRSRHHTMLAEGLPKAVVFDLDGCLWAPDMCA